jgi:hypothetical protein
MLETFAFQDVVFSNITLGATVETVSFSFLSESTSTSTTPLPTALPLFATGLGALGLLGWRSMRKACA